MTHERRACAAREATSCPASETNLHDGDVLQVVLQGVDERRDGEFQGVFVLNDDGVVEEQHRLLHADCRRRQRDRKWAGVSQKTVCVDL